MTDDELDAIRARVQHDAPVWRMGSAEASMAGRFDTWSAMHCTEAGQVYEDRAALLAEVERLSNLYNKRESEIDEIVEYEVWVSEMGEYL